MLLFLCHYTKNVEASSLTPTFIIEPDKKDPDEPTDKVNRDLTFHHYNVRVRKTYFGLLTKIKKDTAHCSRSSTVSLLVHRKRFELLAFGSVDRRYIQLS